MDYTAARNVDAIEPGERKALESLLGVPLQSDQHVLIMAYRPGVEPDAAAKRAARERIEEILDSKAAAGRGDATADEVDAAVDEAMANVRRRS